MEWDLARKLAFSERCQFLVEGLDLEAATGIDGAEWEPFQIAHLNDDGLARHERKCRQVGYSWLIASEAVGNSILHAGSTALFTSINREESAEKIRYARQILEALYPSWRVPLVNDNQFSLVFSNRSRIISLPQRPSRGKAGAWVYLDEFAHYRLDRDIYTGSFPVTTKGGRMRIGSTTFGARGMFWEIDQEQVRPYPGYSRSQTPWWEVSAMLRPEWRSRVGVVSATAPMMPTAERVERFGSDRIGEIYANMPEDDFQQEYECAYVDEAVAYISWDDIMAATVGDDRRDAYSRYWLARDAGGALNAIDEMALEVASGRMGKGPLVWGLDVGRKRDLTELTLMEIMPRSGVHLVRAVLSLDRQKFELQESICRALLSRLPIARGYLDQNGLGMQLAETLTAEFGDRALPAVFSNPSKALWATHLKTRFQAAARRGQAGRHLSGVMIPNDRNLLYQIHSVKRRVSGTGNQVIFDVEASERHHADKFWSLALANEAAEEWERFAGLPSPSQVALRTTRQMEPGQAGSAIAPDLADAIAHQPLSYGKYAQLIEHGIPAELIRLIQQNGDVSGSGSGSGSGATSQRPGAGVVVEADPSPAPSDDGDDGDDDDAFEHDPAVVEALHA